MKILSSALSATWFIVVFLISSDIQAQSQPERSILRGSSFGFDCLNNNGKNE